MFKRVPTEDEVLDSSQNVLFSIAHFRELAGALNDHIDSHCAGPSFDSGTKVFR